jgi:hypothetical protein
MGRPTKEAELLAFAEHIGAEPELVKGFIAEAIPAKKPVADTAWDPDPAADMAAIIADPKQLYEWAVNSLVEHVSSGRANVATVNGLKAVMDFATKQPDAVDDGEQVSVLDRIHALPKDHAAALLRGEIERLDLERGRYFAALTELLEAE